MLLEEAVEQLIQVSQPPHNDVEAAHYKADKILLEYIGSQMFGDKVVAAYKAIELQVGQFRYA